MLYFLDFLHVPEAAGSSESLGPLISLFVPSNVGVWHRRLGDISNKRLRSLIQSGVLGRVNHSPVLCRVLVAKWESLELFHFQLVTMYLHLYLN